MILHSPPARSTEDVRQAAGSHASTARKRTRTGPLVRVALCCVSDPRDIHQSRASAGCGGAERMEAARGQRHAPSGKPMQGQAARQGASRHTIQSNATLRYATRATRRQRQCHHSRGSLRWLAWQGQQAAGATAPVAGECPCRGRGGAGRGARASPGPGLVVSVSVSTPTHKVNPKLSGEPSSLSIVSPFYIYSFVKIHFVINLI